MSYQVTRNGQMYGPYTVEELQQYLGSGNLLPTDMAKGEGMSTWVPVSTLVRVEPPPMTPGFNTPFSPPPVFAGAQMFPPPPNLGWGWLLLLIAVTAGYFSPIWYVVLASWAKKVAPGSAVSILYYICCVMVVIQLVLLVSMGTSSPSYIVTALVGAILYIVTRFKMRTLLEHHYNNVEPIGLTLSGVMTFFFGELYFQYHFNQISRLKGLR